MATALKRTMVSIGPNCTADRDEEVWWKEIMGKLNSKCRNLRAKFEIHFCWLNTVS